MKINVNVLEEMKSLNESERLEPLGEFAEYIKRRFENEDVYKASVWFKSHTENLRTGRCIRIEELGNSCKKKV